MLDPNNDGKAYLPFALDGEISALALDKVREVLDFTTVTRVPAAPGYMRGEIDLRGSLAPARDLRLKFSLSRTATTVETGIIVTEVGREGKTTIIGALAGSVRDLMASVGELPAPHARPPLSRFPIARS